MRKIPFAGIELTSQRVRGLQGTSELPGRPGYTTKLQIHVSVVPLVETQLIKCLQAEQIMFFLLMEGLNSCITCQIHDLCLGPIASCSLDNLHRDRCAILGVNRLYCGCQTNTISFIFIGIQVFQHFLHLFLTYWYMLSMYVCMYVCMYGHHLLYQSYVSTG